MNQLTWCITVATSKKLKATGNGWYYQAYYNCPKVAKGNSPPYVGVDDPLEFSSVLDKLLGHKFAFKVKWQQSFGKRGAVHGSSDSTTLKELAEGEQCPKTTSQAYEDGEEISNVIMFLSSQ
ncbi:hypothetical protein KIW84_062468 [Lathyrus oleraceus]|uniref:Uncharacterized protein n=1 Tax=Pisum sativum TaxID=3888 RepID=A0A9D4W7P6_PEA|nr:hypothetical protein KIW84_062468 [Pisum sativum]